jgi:hypothetical protein
MEILMINGRLVICIAIAAIFIGMAIFAGMIATAKTFEHEEDPIDVPGCEYDFEFSERPYYHGN